MGIASISLAKNGERRREIRISLSCVAVGSDIKLRGNGSAKTPDGAGVGANADSNADLSPGSNTC
jgi:hypothetical protein